MNKGSQNNKQRTVELLLGPFPKRIVYSVNKLMNIYNLTAERQNLLDEIKQLFTENKSI